MFKIGEFAAISGVSRKMLRHYEQLGLLKPAHTDRFTGYRYYTLEQLEPIQRIHTLREAGLTLREVGDVIERDLSVEEFKALLLQKRRELARKQKQITQCLARLEQRLLDIETEMMMPVYDITLKPADDQFSLPTLHALDLPMQVIVPEGDPLDNVIFHIADEAPPDMLACTQHRGERKQLNYALHALHHWVVANTYCVVGPPNIIEFLSESEIESHYYAEIQLPIRKA
jgi:DNA-binding transcriptional MerR regulator